MKYAAKSFVLHCGEPVIVESAKEIDAESLWSFGVALAQEHEFQAMFPDEFTIKVEDEPKFIKDCEEHPCKLALVARTQQGKVVGLCTIMPVSRYRKMLHVAVTTIGVLSQYRNKKLGQILLTEALSVAKENSTIEKIGLRVLSTNTRAIALYKKLGFVEVGRLKKEFKFSQDDYRDDVLMELLLR